MANVALAGTADLSAPSGVRASPKQVAAVVTGNSLEFYDFITYAYFAIYIGQVFFPSHDPTTSLLASLATFGAGFVTRPLGAIIIGRLADRIGRKPAMLLSFALMGAAILGLALTPSYASIGIAAPILVITFRLLQGFALGGELGPSTTYLIEAAPPHRRGYYVSFQYVGQSVAGLVAGVIGMVLANVMSEDSLRDYGWRIAMLFGAAIIPIGLMLRRNLEETLHEPEPMPVAISSAGSKRPHLRIAFLGVLMMAAGTTVAYVLKYLTTYAIATLHMPASVAFGGSAIGGFMGVFVSPLGGWLSDRFGRKPVMIVPWVLLLLATLPCFAIISHYRTALALYSASCVLGALGTIAAASVLVSVTEALPKHVRSGTLALVYALAITIFGGSAQLNVAWLISVTGSPLAPAWYMMVGVSIGLIAMINMRETNPAIVRKR